tara:strand:+ start:1194 stop:1541 length:348 start_codon:yes stop_codon:yes gene_type:complete
MKLYGLYKNGNLAKISQDCNHLESDGWELTEDEKLLNLTPHIWTVSEIKNNLTFPKIPRSNESLGLRGDGGPRLTQSTSMAIGNAFERAGITECDWSDDSEFKSRKTIDKLNEME